METRVVRKKEWFAGLPGVEGGTGSVQEGGSQANMGAFRASNLPENKLREVTPATASTPEKTKLISQTGRHLMVHIYETLRDDERELFADQVLSEMTKREFSERGFALTDAFDLLKAQEEQVVAFLQAVPDAELTPGTVVRPLGNRVQRVMAGPNTQASQALSIGLIGMDMVMERGQWRLRWFVPGPNYEMPRILEPWEREALRQQQIAKGQVPTDERMHVPGSALNKPKVGVDSGLDSLSDGAPVRDAAPAPSQPETPRKSPLPPPR
jgi:hypothetical protein